MRLKPEQLTKQLTQALLPVYLVAGDEPLQQEELLDQLRAAARAQGFDDRKRFSTSTGLDWNSISAAANSMGLFGGRCIIDIQLQNKRPDKAGSETLRALLEHPSPDTLLIISCSRLDRRKDLKTAWFNAIEATGAVVEVWPQEGPQLHRWLGDRLRSRGLSADADTIALLAARSEGNLMAAAQDIDKLVLLAADGRITAETVNQAVGNSSRYTPFDISSATATHSPAQLLDMLEQVKQAGVEPVLLLWALTRDLRILDGLNNGGAPPRLPPKRVASLKTQAARLDMRDIAACLSLAGKADQAIKGQGEGSPWRYLTAIVLRMNGAAIPALLER